MSLRQRGKCDRIDKENFETEQNLATDSHIYRILIYGRPGILEWRTSITYLI